MKESGTSKSIEKFSHSQTRATAAILAGSLADDPQAVRQDLKATKALAFFLRQALRYDAHPCMAREARIHRSMNFSGMQSTSAHC